MLVNVQRGTPDRLTVTINGKSAHEFRGQLSSIAQPLDVAENHLRTGLWAKAGGSFVFHDFSLHMVEGEAKPLRSPGAPASSQEGTPL